MLLKDIPFDPKYTDAAMKKARELLSVIPTRAGSVANFCIVSDSGVASEHYSQACHHHIGHTELRDRSLVVTEAGWKRRSISPLSRELAAIYADYIGNRFYAGRFVLNRDPDEWLDGGFIVSCDAPAPLLQNFCIASRAFYEVTTATFEKFRELLDNGIHPDVAYISCFSTGASHPLGGFEGDSRPIEATHAVTNGGGHRPHRLLPLSALTNMVNGIVGTAYNRPLDGTDTHRTNSGYKGGSLLFDLSEHTTDAYGSRMLRDGAPDLVSSLFVSEEFKAILREHRLGNAASETYRPPNPFAPKAAFVRPDQLSNKEFYEIAVPYINTVVTGQYGRMETTMTSTAKSIAA